MLPASNRGVGMSLNFPDVCKTPAPPAPFVPIPYPDLGLNMQAAPFSPFVSIAFVPATNMASLKVMTSGDEAGTLGGLVTGMIKGPGKTTIGNPIVFVTGLPAESLLNPTSGNMMNAPVGAQIVPSVVNVLYTYREAEPGGVALGADAVRALADVARGEGHAEEPARIVCRWLPGGIAHLPVGLFTAGTDREVWNALRAGGEEELRAVVLDLRGNPGGDAGSALRLAAAFLPAGTTMLLQRDDDGDEDEIRARGAQTYTVPVCVLVDGGTASAAELVAAALQHAGRASIVGIPSFGKATGQQVIVGPTGETRYATTATFLRPDGSPIDGRGVAPDVVVERGTSATGAATSVDLQLDAALALVASLVARRG